MQGLTMTGDRLDVMSMIQSLKGSTPTPTATPTPTPTPSVNNIYGSIYSDSITGTTGNDKIWGVPASGTSLGRGTIDTLHGNGGSDIFVLGDSRGRFYDDGRSLYSGTGDYAKITDFTAGDKLQLRGAADDYMFKWITLNGVYGSGVYYDSNNNNYLDSRDELIALVAGNHVLTGADLTFI
jgi:hypothetical protein